VEKVVIIGRDLIVQQPSDVLQLELNLWVDVKNIIEFLDVELQSGADNIALQIVVGDLQREHEVANELLDQTDRLLKLQLIVIVKSNKTQTKSREPALDWDGGEQGAWGGWAYA